MFGDTWERESMKCTWCQKNEVEFQLVIYTLRKEKEIVANKSNKQEQLVRDRMYLKVYLCEKCLPCTATTNPIRTKLRGSELKNEGHG